MVYVGVFFFVEEKYKNGSFVSGKYSKNGKSKSAAVRTDNSQIQAWIFMPISITRTEKPELATDYMANETF